MFENEIKPKSLAKVLTFCSLPAKYEEIGAFILPQLMLHIHLTPLDYIIMPP